MGFCLRNDLVDLDMNRYLLTILFIVFWGCEDKNTETNNDFIPEQYAEYVGNWYKTFFAQYDSSECAGDNYMGEGPDTTQSEFYSLFEDGTTLTTDTWFCAAPDNASNSNCKGTWNSIENRITISNGFISLTYQVAETNGNLKMSTELKGYSDMDEENPMCQLYEYTKLIN